MALAILDLDCFDYRDFFVDAAWRHGVRMGHGHKPGNGGHAHQNQGSDGPHADPDVRPTDPVSGEIVNPQTALNSMYQERVYYFASRENRDAFEASPAQHASRTGELDAAHRHHRNGC